ncbi:hypothetical protein A4X20_22535 [Mycolicibacterium iranicum]|uniref:Uncharacterized protein n=1 Tax=Mycolicibacterium iranicum TaxID=912594 RepID=A0A178LUA0_MYCIR|nr:hypothetical protein A4X20_22535 [Mycolicibacterium iranicum]
MSGLDQATADSRNSRPTRHLDRFLSEGQTTQVHSFAQVRLDISDYPTRHPYGLMTDAHRASARRVGR